MPGGISTGGPTGHAAEIKKGSPDRAIPRTFLDAFEIMLEATAASAAK
jgi:hypothetical protein